MLAVGGIAPEEMIVNDLGFIAVERENVSFSACAVCVIEQKHGAFVTENEEDAIDRDLVRFASLQGSQAYPRRNRCDHSGISSENIGDGKHG